MKLLLSVRFWLVAGLVLRLAYLNEQYQSSPLFFQPLLDEEEMKIAAEQLLAGHGFGAEPLFKAPLYPIYLAGVMFISGDEWFLAARLIQNLLGVVLIFFAWDCARRCLRGRGGTVAGALAAGAIALYGPLIRLEHILTVDFFSVFLQSAMLWSLTRLHGAVRRKPTMKWAALAGLFAALAWLNRPTIMLALPFMAIWLVIASRRAKWQALTLFAALPLLAMLGVFVRNATVGNEPMLLPWQGGYNFYHANGAAANGRYYLQSEYSLAQSGNPTRELAIAGYRSAWPGNAPLKFKEVDKYWFARARGEIRENQSRWLLLMAKKLLWLTSNTEIFNFEVYDVQRRQSAVLRWLPVRLGIIWPLALASLPFLFHVPRRARARISLFWIYSLALGGAIALYYVSGRMRMPLVFPVAVLAGITIANFSAILRKPNLGTLFATILFLIAGAAMSWGDWGGVRSEKLEHLEYARLSNAAWRSGMWEEAIHYAEAAEEAKPGYPTTALLRGQALYSIGRIDEAATAFIESMSRLPGDPVAPFNLGVIRLYDRVNVEEAVTAFEEALRRQPQYHQAAWLAAIAHMRLRQMDQAAEKLAPYMPIASNEPPMRLLIAAGVWYALEGDTASFDIVKETMQRVHGNNGVDELINELQMQRRARGG